MNQQMRSTTSKVLLLVFLSLCAAALLVEVLLDRHTEIDGEELFAFYPLYGFVSIIVLVLLAKALRRLARREEDYYGD